MYGSVWNACAMALSAGSGVGGAAGLGSRHDPDPASFAADLAALAWQVEARRRRGDRRGAGRPVRGRPAPPAARAAPEARAGGRGLRLAASSARRSWRRGARTSRRSGRRWTAFEGCALKQGARSLVFADGDPAGAADGDRRGAGAGGGPRGAAVRRAVGAAARPDAGGDRAVAAGGGSARPGPTSPTCCRGGRRRTAIPRGTRRRRCCRSSSGTSSSRRRSSCCSSARRRRGRCSATEFGVTRLGGRWHEWRGVPVMVTFHPAAVLREPARKREVWADLLMLKARMGG